MLQLDLKRFFIQHCHTQFFDSLFPLINVFCIFYDRCIRVKIFRFHQFLECPKKIICCNRSTITVTGIIPQIKCINLLVLRNFIAVCHSVLKFVLIHPHKSFQQITGNRLLCTAFQLQMIQAFSRKHAVIDVPHNFFLPVRFFRYTFRFLLPCTSPCQQHYHKNQKTPSQKTFHCHFPFSHHD